MKLLSNYFLKVLSVFSPLTPNVVYFVHNDTGAKYHNRNCFSRLCFTAKETLMAGE